MGNVKGLGGKAREVRLRRQGLGGGVGRAARTGYQLDPAILLKLVAHQPTGCANKGPLSFHPTTHTKYTTLRTPQHIICVCVSVRGWGTGAGGKRRGEA